MGIFKRVDAAVFILTIVIIQNRRNISAFMIIVSPFLENRDKLEGEELH